MKYSVSLLLVLLFGCNIIPDGAGTDLPTASTIVGLNYTYYENSASATYEITGSTTTVDWTFVSGDVFPTIENPVSTRIKKSGNYIESIEHLDAQNELLYGFTFSYLNGRFDQIILVTPEETIMDQFTYSLTGDLQQVDRTRTDLSGNVTLGLLVGLGPVEFIFMDPYDPNAAGPGEGAFDDPGSVNWNNHIRFSWDPAEWNSFYQGSTFILRGIEGGSYDIDNQIGYEIYKRIDPVTSGTQIYYMGIGDLNGTPRQQYLNPFLIEPNEYFESKFGILQGLYLEYLGTGAKLDPFNNNSYWPTSYQFILDFE